MRILLTFIFFFALTRLSLAQQCILAKSQRLTVYLHQPNDVYVMVEGKPCKQIRVTTDNGEIRQSLDACTFILTPSHLGIAKITISDIKSRKRIKTIDYRVDSVGPPLAIVANQFGGQIKKSLLAAQLGVRTNLDEFHPFMVVLGFTVAVNRGDSNIFSKRVEGAVFDEEIKKAFGSLEPGDHVLFSAISSKNYLGTISHLQPIEFIISK